MGPTETGLFSPPPTPLLADAAISIFIKFRFLTTPPPRMPTKPTFWALHFGLFSGHSLFEISPSFSESRYKLEMVYPFPSKIPQKLTAPVPTAIGTNNLPPISKDAMSFAFILTTVSFFSVKETLFTASLNQARFASFSMR